MVRRNSREAGFTLLEIGLALSIALLASVAVVVFYSQVKESAGDSAMREKIGSLQAVVESLYTAQGACPTLADVQQAWFAKRSDCLKSPWGGDIYDMTTPPTGGMRAGVTGSSTLYAGTDPGAVESNAGVGILYYYRVVNAAAPNLPNAAATAYLYDVTQGATVSVTGYGVAGLKHNGWRHFMVTSGR